MPRRITSLFSILILGCTLSGASAQETSLQPTSPNIIRGTVINKSSHQPIAHALVYSGDERFGMFTDSRGRFEFTLPEISSSASQRGTFVIHNVFYNFNARKPGFLDDPQRVQSPITPGADLTIALMPEAIIRGRVMISKSEPAAGINVQLFMRQVQEGFLRWAPGPVTRTSSSGEFRFAELRPGEYKVFTLELMDADPVDAVPGGQAYAFPPAYFPGVADFASGATIRLAAGERFQADIPISREPYFRVVVPVVNSDKVQGLNVRVLAQGHPGPGYALAYNGAAHRIEGLLPTGNYVLEATGFGPTPTYGTSRLTVTNAPTEGPAMALLTPIAIPVNVHEEFSNEFNGTSVYSNDKGSFQVRGPRAYFHIQLWPADDFSQRGILSEGPPGSAEDQSIVIQNVQPGRYWVQAQTAHGYVQSLTSGGVDLLRAPLVVTSGSHEPIEVTLRDDSAIIEGTIAGLSVSAQNPGPGMPNSASGPAAYVYCIPLPDSSGTFQQFWASADGAIHSSPISPGAYRILAFASPQSQLAYRDPEAMKAYENQGAVVRLEPGVTEHIQLQISGE